MGRVLQSYNRREIEMIKYFRWFIFFYFQKGKNAVQVQKKFVLFAGEVL